MPAHPTQADLGSQQYYQICMACHGDKGQGLTQEFRAVLDPPDQNCWQSKCHAANHPPGGFVFPTYVPPVVGPAALARFDTALDLYNFIKAKMPYNAPDSLSDDVYWQMAAFIARSNGVWPGNSTLNAQNAASVRLHPKPRPPLAWLVAAALAVALGATVAAWLLFRRSRRAIPAP